MNIACNWEDIASLGVRAHACCDRPEAAFPLRGVCGNPAGRSRSGKYGQRLLQWETL